MHNRSDEFKITSMSRVLGVSRSGFYRWRQRGKQPTRREQQRLALDKLVADAFVARKMRADSPSLVLDLHDQGHVYDRKNCCRQHETAVSKLKMHTLARYFIPLMMSRFRWIVSGFESLLWGYGERPSRIVLVALSLIGCYAGAYYLVEWVDANGCSSKMDLWDSVYFSIVTFTTLGYRDITPKTLLLKSLAGSEALLGVFSMGLIVAGFSNRSRY